MIGVWQRAGEANPFDGEPIVYIEPFGSGEMICGVYRWSMVQEQNGSTRSLPWGTFWTSLPPPPDL